MKQPSKYTALALTPLMALAGCNFFSVIDKPSGDGQILSAARGAVDRGDFEKARELYGKLASADDQATAEVAFLNLNEAGAGLGAFMNAFGDGGSSSGITALAKSIAEAGATEAHRKLIIDALNSVDEITDAESIQLRGLVRLMSAAALMGASLAIDADLTGGENDFEISDLMTTPASCGSTTAAACLTTAAACVGPTGSKFTFEAGAAMNFINSPIDQLDSAANPTSRWFHGAIKAIDFALTNELNAGGKFGTGLAGLVPDAAFTQGNDQCFRSALREAGVVE